MTDKVSDLECVKSKSDNQEMYGVLRTFNEINKKIEENLNDSKAEQNNICSILRSVPIKGKNSPNAIPNDVPQIHVEECCDKNEKIKKLQAEIATLKRRRRFDQQLSQETIKKLETEQTKCRNAFKLQNKQQMKMAKSHCSIVLETLKNEIFEAKDNFVKQQSLQQSLWLADKIMMEQKNEKLDSSLQDLQEIMKQKDEMNQQMVQSLTEELSGAKAEIQRLNHLNINKEKRLNESEKVVNSVKAKNEEIQRNIAEAFNLVNHLQKEKNDVLQREAMLVEQNAKLETQLASIIKDDPIKMQEEMIKDINAYQERDDAKEYFHNFPEEVKSASQIKDILIANLVRENISLEDEKNKVELENKFFQEIMHESAVARLQDFAQRNFGQTSIDTDSKTCDKCKFEMHSLKEQELPEEITNLVILNDENPTENVGNLKLADEETKENDTSARLIRLENQLIDATNAKAYLISEIKSLRMSFDCEIRKRNEEQDMLEGKIRELEINLQKINKAEVQKSAKRTSEEEVKKIKSDTGIHPVQGSFQHCEDTISTCTWDTISTCTFDESNESKDDEPESLLAGKTEQLGYFNKKMKTMKHFIKTHKNFNKRSADETKAITEKFRVKFNEFRGQMSIFKKKYVKLEKTNSDF